MDENIKQSDGGFGPSGTKWAPIAYGGRSARMRWERAPERESTSLSFEFKAREDPVMPEEDYVA